MYEQNHLDRKKYKVITWTTDINSTHPSVPCMSMATGLRNTVIIYLIDNLLYN